jgi:hypothetical protein
LLAQKMNQKRAPEMTNFVHPYARYTNPARYRLAKISHHFRSLPAPKVVKFLM